MKKNWLVFILCIIGVQLIGILSAFFSPTKGGWYENLIKPPFNPPNYLFGIVWPILYILIGISLFLIINSGKNKFKSITLKIFSIQLLFNFFWSFIFFKLNSLFFSLIEIFLLWILITLNIVYSYKISKISSYLLIPYLIWVSFAVILNFSIFILN